MEPRTSIPARRLEAVETLAKAGVRVNVIADHGAFNSTAQPTKYPAGFFHVFTGSYDLEAAHCEVTGVYTNKMPTDAIRGAGRPEATT